MLLGSKCVCLSFSISASLQFYSLKTCFMLQYAKILVANFFGKPEKKSYQHKTSQPRNRLAEAAAASDQKPRSNFSTKFTFFSADYDNCFLLVWWLMMIAVVEMVMWQTACLFKCVGCDFFGKSCMSMLVSSRQCARFGWKLIKSKWWKWGRERVNYSKSHAFARKMLLRQISFSSNRQI